MIKALGEIGDIIAVPSLIPALDNKDIEIKKAAVEALGKIKDERAVLPLIAGFINDKEIKEIIFEALINICKSEIETFTALLKNTNRNIRKTTASVLNSINWQPADLSQHISYLIADENWDELVKLGALAINPLFNMIKDEAINISVIKTLGKIKDNKAVELLIANLTSTDSHSTKIATIEVLGEIGSSNRLGQINF